MSYAPPLSGTTGTVVQALRLALDWHHQNPDNKINKEVIGDMVYLLTELFEGKMILDPWCIDDVYAQADELNLNEEQAIDVLTAFKNNDYRTESGNEMIAQLADEMYGE
jgi:hypothetical protein